MTLGKDERLVQPCSEKSGKEQQVTSELELEGKIGKRHGTCEERENLGRAGCILGITSNLYNHYIGLCEGSEE